MWNFLFVCTYGCFHFPSKLPNPPIRYNFCETAHLSRQNFTKKQKYQKIKIYILQCKLFLPAGQTSNSDQISMLHVLPMVNKLASPNGWIITGFLVSKVLHHSSSLLKHFQNIYCIRLNCFCLLCLIPQFYSKYHLDRIHHSQ